MKQDVYRHALKERICSRCREVTQKQVCNITGSPECGIEKHLTALVEMVHTVNSNSIFDYVVKMREVICSRCSRLEQGFCDLDQGPTCAIDKYLSLIIETIEEIDELESSR